VFFRKGTEKTPKGGGVVVRGQKRGLSPTANSDGEEKEVNFKRKGSGITALQYYGQKRKRGKKERWEVEGSEKGGRTAT